MQDAIFDRLNEMDGQFYFTMGMGFQFALLWNIYKGNTIYNHILVNQFNGNPFLSKNKLTCVRKSMCFNHLKNNLVAAIYNTCLLDNYGATIMVFTLCNIPLITKLA
jgi:hypothetical protein